MFGPRRHLAPKLQHGNLNCQAIEQPMLIAAKHQRTARTFRQLLPLLIPGGWPKIAMNIHVHGTRVASSEDRRKTYIWGRTPSSWSNYSTHNRSANTHRPSLPVFVRFFELW
jgi:hypothetical protein